jgi:N-acetylglutamate synthase-like GNAT family acetyltransferase
MTDREVDGPVLRRAAGADARAVNELVRAAYGPYGPLIGRTPMPMLVDYEDAISDHDVWVLSVGDHIVGVLHLVAKDDHLWIENVAVTPAWQGRGLGRRLLAHAEAEAQRQGLAEMRLLTNERYTANVAMYARYGYLETHRTPHLGTDLVHFRKPVMGQAPRSG